MDARRRVYVGVSIGHDRGHGAARGEAGNVDAAGVDRVLVDDVFGEPRDQGRLATAAVLVFGLEPVPVQPRIGAARLLRVGDQETVAFGQLVHSGAGGKVICALRTTVQHHDQGDGPTVVPSGHVKLARALPGRVAIR